MNTNKDMKNVHRLLVSLGIALLFSACAHEEVATYDTRDTRLNIWVGTAAGVAYESVTYNYSYAYEEGSITFYARITGMPVDHDRMFRLEVFGDDAERVAPTVRTEDFVIPANAIGGTYQLHLNTQLLPDASLFTTTVGRVHFRVSPDEVFGMGTEDYQSFTLVVKNYLAKPENWDAVPPRNDMLIYFPLSKYFGSYSRVKYQFMIEHLGLVDFQIRSSMGALPSYDEDTNTISATYAVQLQQVMQQALKDYNATHETPLTDEYGEPVTFD